MKKTMYAAIFAALALLTAFAAATNWKVKTDEAVVKFTSSKANGSFSGLKADIEFDRERPEEAKISASIDATSIATGFFLKTMHAKDALGVDQYPTIKFVSTSVSKIGSGYLAKGNLTMKGATKPADINFTFDGDGNHGTFKGVLKVVPRNFNIDRNGTPNEVVINLTVPVTK